MYHGGFECLGPSLSLVLLGLFADAGDPPPGVSKEVLLLFGERAAAGVVEEGLAASTPMPRIHNEEHRHLPFLSCLVKEWHGPFLDARGRGEPRELEPVT